MVLEFQAAPIASLPQYWQRWETTGLQGLGPAKVKGQASQEPAGQGCKLSRATVTKERILSAGEGPAVSARAVEIDFLASRVLMRC